MEDIVTTKYEVILYESELKQLLRVKDELKFEAVDTNSTYNGIQIIVIFKKVEYHNL